MWVHVWCGRFQDRMREIRQFQETTEYLKTQLAAGRISAMMNPATYVLVNLAIISVFCSPEAARCTRESSHGAKYRTGELYDADPAGSVALANLIVTVMRGNCERCTRE